MFLVRLWPDDLQIGQIAMRWSTPGGQTIVRLPLFLAFIALLVGGASVLQPRFDDADTATAEIQRPDARRDSGRERFMRPVAFLIVAVLAWTVLNLAYSMLHADDGLASQYYDNPTWSGSPAHAGTDAVPSTGLMVQRWGATLPDAFSVVWTGYLRVGRSAFYDFATSSDDGSQLQINDQIVVDNGGVHGVVTRSGRIWLDRGAHAVQLRYAQNGGRLALTWSWSTGDERFSPVPSTALSLSPPGFAKVVSSALVDVGLWLAAVLMLGGVAWCARNWTMESSNRVIG